MDNGPKNWGCGTDMSNITVESCQFAQDYLAFIALLRTLGPSPGQAPVIYLAAPPPLMQHGSIGANQTVINSVFPQLIPMIAQAANVSTVPISVYAGMGGVPNWEATFPSSCTEDSPWPACAWWCDSQSCDQCHPNDGEPRKRARARTTAPKNINLTQTLHPLNPNQTVVRARARARKPTPQKNKPKPKPYHPLKPNRATRTWRVSSALAWTCK